ncbi:putative E3 ubiquitin-protein ligase XBOS32 [Apostasia shenzhenica]|uniref:RING-type E3 ubiquitin transferase n=1 Tax=Apostasia shenzhenica TaxID=1088818 RepID=A0A2I0AUA8_9ASPA|nr:putative E3 ubiquitin-protein ligase XBOS32 [Apostasia shenzhenica]
MSIMRIAREHGWRGTIHCPPSVDPCAVYLERRCTVIEEGCQHEFCTQCALDLCSTSSTSATISAVPGSIPCPLCRHAIMISFSGMACESPVREPPRSSLSLSLCTTCQAVGAEPDAPDPMQSCRPDFSCTMIPPLGFGFISVSQLPEIFVVEKELLALHGSSRCKPMPCSVL